MAAEFRAPKAVQEEATANVGELALRIASPLSIEDVMEIRTSWIGQSGIEWANKITTDIALRAAVITKGELVSTRDDSIDLESIDRQSILDELNAADSALYYAFDNIIAAGCCIWNLQSKFQPDDMIEDPMMEMNSAQSVIDRFMQRRASQAIGGTSLTNDAKETLMIEDRKSAIATAERITMHAEVRSIATEDGTLKIGGYAATFNQEASGLNFREMIAPGAFTRTLQSDNPVFLLVNHDTDSLPLASTASTTLRLSEDSTGLRMEADLDPANPFASALASALERGDVDKMSFSFTVEPGGSTKENGLRTLTDLNLYEVSIVTWPAYDSTSASMRSAQEAENEALELRRKGLQLKARLISIKK